MYERGALLAACRGDADMGALTRRHFLLTAASLSVACVGRGSVVPSPVGVDAKVRLPAVGQSWRYAKRDAVSGEMVDTEVDRVSAVGQSIEIESHSETTKDEPLTYPSWGASWLQKYWGHDRPSGPVPSEIQEPWGMVLVDPHWSELQIYEKPIPLWPTELRPGWSTTVFTHYKTAERQELLDWQLTMNAHGWESITVTAGHFTALRYHNQINFRFTNASERVAAQREENIWFAPDIGRWVARESWGTFYQDVGERFHESSYRWELLHWS
jgi:hypothetical protein